MLFKEYLGMGKKLVEDGIDKYLTESSNLSRGYEQKE